MFKKITGLVKKELFPSKNFSDYIKGDIDSDIFDLLWFADGPWQNYARESKITEFQEGPLTFRIEFSGSDEPSAIYTKLPVIQSKSVENLGYYPSYHGLTPAQRWVYLKWLKNPYEEIDIGYVFILYYGLERHLLFGEFEKAFETIIKLRKVHRNNSFLSYSQDALILSSFFQKSQSNLKVIYESLNEDNTKGSMSVYLLCKLLNGLKLSAEEILLFAKSVGFTNYRYIKSERSLFIQILNTILIELNNEPFLDLAFLKKVQPPTSKVCFLANISFENEKRYVSIPDYTQEKAFNEMIYRLLSGAHEFIKKELKKARKKGSHKIKKTSNSHRN